MEVLKRNVTRPACLGRFPLAGKCYGICYVANHRWPDLDRLGIEQCQCLRMQNQHGKYLLGIDDSCVPLL